MKKAFNRVISMVLVFFVSFSSVSVSTSAAGQEMVCPYVLFAGSDEEGAISLFTGNTCVNGNICTNGRLSVQGHINMNGTITEDAGMEMPDLWQWIESRKKSGDIISYTGNIDIYDDIRLCNENVLACENGDITINCSQAEINSLVYAPGGTVSISAGNLNMNNVIIIAERIVINSPNVNANYSSSLARQMFVTKKAADDSPSENNSENDGGNIGSNVEGNSDNNGDGSNENGGNNTDDDRELYTVTFDLCGISDAVISEQYVYEGEYVVEPEEPEAKGYMFLGWDRDPEHTQYFDPEKDAVTENLHLYAYWYNEMDETDTDEDGILDELEKLLELDPYSDDSDGDGLPDNMETDVSIMDATKYDTDGNGIADGEEDFDGDALKNVDEIDLGTNFCDDDTDNDGLSDGDEYLVYGTDPLIGDTDEDEVDDFKEISYGTDPLVSNTLFDVVCSVDKDEYEEADIDFSVSLRSIEAEQVDSLDVVPVINDTLFPTDMPGYMGCAYDISMPGTFEEAVLIFEFDPDKYGDDVDPVVYYFDEEEQELIPYDTTVSGNKAIAVTNHFSKYILIDRGKFDKNRELYDKWGDVDFSNLEVMFLFGETISNNMPDVMSKREEDLFDLIDLIPDNAEIGEVAIGYDAAAYGGFINNKNDAKKYFMKTHFKLKESCLVNVGIDYALDEFEKGDTTAKKILVVFYGGSLDNRDGNYEIVNKANNLGVRIYCVGYGERTAALENHMSFISSFTGGKTFDGNSDTWVQRIAPELQMGVDTRLDSDDDGLPDYYEDFMPIFNGKVIKTDKNNPDTDGDGLLDGEEVVIKRESVWIDPTNARFKTKVKLNSNPTSKDSDGDGLLDNDPILRNGEVVVPPDNKRMDYNGPKGIWKKHVQEMQYGDVATEYASAGSQEELNKILDGMKNQHVAEKIRKEVKKLLDISRDIAICTEDELDYFVEEYAETIEALLYTTRIKCTLFQTHIISAILCNFVQDNLGQAYHSVPETWQKNFGYTKLFDDAFRVGTDMNNRKIDFNYNDHKYALWLWKGDYWNLGTGAEVGLYKMSEETVGENPNSAAAHYDAVEFLLPMQLSLYRTNTFNMASNYYNWQPTESQWWITGFVPEHRFENPNKIVMVAKVDFSYKKSLAKALYESKNVEELDDSIFYNDSLWFIWKGRIG